VRAEALDPVATRVHYFLGNRPGEWVRNVPTFQRIVWRGVYPGIDVIGYARDGRLEYDFIVGPGADPSAIRLRFDGVRSLSLDEEGGLLLRTPAGFVRHRAPVVHQQDGDRLIPVACSYRLVGDCEIQLNIDAWDTSRTLVIDPVVEFSTSLGGDGLDYAYAVTDAPDGPAPDGTNPRTAVQHGWENYVDPEPGAWSNLFYRIQVP
jgi:hypothetical protein